MSAILLSLTTFFSTLVGGLFGLRYRDHLYLIMGFTAGVLVGLVSFDLLPEIFRLFGELAADGKTLLVVTHDPAAATSVSRTITIVDGCVA